jgi:hypothetical protein
MRKNTKRARNLADRPRRCQQASSDAHNLLRKVIVLESHDSYGHLWNFEGDRWKELVFALLVGAAPHLVESDIRNLVERMQALRLLEVADLASICGASNKPSLRHEHARLIVDLLIECAFTKEQAERGLLTICEAAIGLQKHFAGKIQRYLRGYGELMIKESKNVFRFTTLTEAEIRYSLTYWLQNVLSMPLPLFDRSWVAVCSQHGVEPSHLVSAADDFGINLALVDDLLRAYLARREHHDNRTEAVPLVNQRVSDARSGEKVPKPARSVPG